MPNDLASRAIPPKTLFLGVDQGTSATKAALISSNGELVDTFEYPVGHLRSEAIIVEQDANELAESIIQVVQAAKRVAGCQIASVGLSLQRSGVLAWNRDDQKPLHPMITWADRRFVTLIDTLASNAALVHERCGLPLTAHYAAPKIAALQKQFPGAAVGTLDSYLISKFGGGAFVSEHTMAARTMLYRLDRGEWDPKLCSIFSVDRQRLASICVSQRIHGQIEGISWRSCLGDQQAVLLARRARGVDLSLNLGSIASLCWCTGENPMRASGMIASVLDSKRAQREFLLEGVSNCCGALIEQLHQLVSAQQLEELVTESDPKHTTVVYYPLKGEGSPYWRSNLPSLIESDGAPDRASLVTALIENLVFFIADNFTVIETLRGSKVENLAVSGGVAKSQAVLNKLSQAIKRVLVVDQGKHLGAIGAALGACRALGLDVPQPKLQMINHSIPACEFLDRRYARWRALRAQAMKGSNAAAKVFYWEMLSAA